MGGESVRQGVREDDARETLAMARMGRSPCCIARQRERRTRAIRCRRWQSRTNRASGEHHPEGRARWTLVRGVGEMRRVGSRKKTCHKAAWKKEPRAGWPRGSMPCPVRRVPGGAGGAVEYRVEEGGGRLGGGLQRLPGKAKVSGHSRVGEHPAGRRRRQG
jgi:hypothetical protein